MTNPPTNTTNDGDIVCEDCGFVIRVFGCACDAGNKWGQPDV